MYSGNLGDGAKPSHWTYSPLQQLLYWSLPMYQIKQNTYHVMSPQRHGEVLQGLCWIKCHIAISSWAIIFADLNQPEKLSASDLAYNWKLVYWFTAQPWNLESKKCRCCNNSYGNTHSSKSVDFVQCPTCNPGEFFFPPLQTLLMVNIVSLTKVHIILAKYTKSAQWCHFINLSFFTLST